MRSMKKEAILLMVCLVSSMSAFAQTGKEVSDKELEQFAAAAQQVQMINQEAQQKMINTVEEQGLDVQRFSEIQQAQQDPQQELEATEEEVEKYEASTREFEKIQLKAQREMEEKITEGGLTVPRYQEIAMTLQSDPELQKKFQMIQQRNN